MQSIRYIQTIAIRFSNSNRSEIHMLRKKIANRTTETEQKKWTNTKPHQFFLIDIKGKKWKNNSKIDSKPFESNLKQSEQKKTIETFLLRLRCLQKYECNFYTFKRINLKIIVHTFSI